MLESVYQGRLIEDIEDMFPGAIILKNDTSYLQGIPDLSIFYKKNWAMLEVKPHRNARTRPNQPYYVDLANSMSFGAFIYPENQEDVLRELQHAFAQPRRAALVSKRQ